jgi:hypothetical protein
MDLDPHSTGNVFANCASPVPVYLLLVQQAVLDSEYGKFQTVGDA